MTGMDLVEFLTARLDEAEQVAKLLSGRRWYAYEDGRVVESVPGETWADGGDILPNRHSSYWSMFDPARVLREVEAKREILDEHECQEAKGPLSGPQCCRCVQEMHGWQEDWSAQEYPCRTLRFLASVYADHPDFRQEWAL